MKYLLTRMLIAFSIIITTAFGLTSCGPTSNPKDESEEITITILQTADIHSYLNPHEELFVEGGQPIFRRAGGLAHIKTLVDQVRSENPQGTVFIDGGDLIQGSGESILSKGEIFPSIVSLMNYDAIIPGNWEVIYGKEVMLDVMNRYGTDVIAANMYHEDSDLLFPPYKIIEKKGVRMAFIAYNDPEVPVRQNPSFSKGITFSKVEQNLQELIDNVRNKEKADLVFLVTHLGISKQLMLADNPAIKGVDFIFGNDTHERIHKPIQGKYAKVVEPGAFGSFVGRLDITLQKGKIIRTDYHLLEVDPEKYPADEIVQKQIDLELAPYQNEMKKVIGYTKTPLYRYQVVENSMDNLITDALRWKTGADIATSNGFRFGVPILPKNGNSEAITEADLWRMLPVNEHMKIGKVTGLQIKEWLEKEINNVFAKNPSDRFGGWLVRFSGMTLKFDSSREFGNRILEITIGNEPLKEDKLYTMASCNRTGESLTTMCRLKGAEDVELQSYTLHDAVRDYLAYKTTVHPEIDGRSTDINSGKSAFSEIKEVNYQFK